MKEKTFGKKLSSSLLWLYNNFCTLFACIAGVGACAITVINVFARYALNHSYPGVEELVMICFAYVVFMGAASAYKAKMHYGIDVFVNFCPEKIRNFVNLFTQLLITISMAYTTYLAFSYAISCIRRTTSFSRISYFWIILPMGVGFLFITLYALEDFIRALKKDNSLERGGNTE